MSSFHAGVTIGLSVSSDGEGARGEVVEDGLAEDVGGGWGLVLDGLVPGFEGLLSECSGG